MDILEHDPNSKLRVRDALLLVIYQPCLAKMQASLTKIIDRNNTCWNAPQNGFLFQGKYYSVDNRPPPPVDECNFLHPKLFSEMFDYLKKEREILDESARIDSYLTKILNASDSFPDYFKLFPAFLHPTLQKFVDSCPCHNRQLNDAEIQSLQKESETAVQLIQERMVFNILL